MSETPLVEPTPEEQAEIDRLNKNLPYTPIIKHIFENQEFMIKGFEDERKFNQSEFEKGSEKFKEIFGELKEVRSEVSDMKSQIADGFKKNEDKLDNYITEVKDKRYDEIAKKLEKREQKEDREKENEKSSMANRQSQIIVGLVLLLAGALVTIAVNVITENRNGTEIVK